MKTIHTLICFGAALLTSSCIYDSSLNVAEETVPEEITLHLNIAAGSTITRGSEHSNYNSETAESFINVEDNDFRIYILDGKNDMIIKEFQPTSISELSKDSYKLSGSFPYDKSLQNIKILVFANWATDFTNGYPDIPLDGTVCLSDLYSNKNDYNFLYPQKENSESWFPENSGSKKTGIPMVGISESVNIPEKIKNLPGLSPDIEISSIPLLRGLAKIVVENTMEDTGFEVMECSLSKYNTNGRLIPDVNENPDWFKGETQVVKPSFPNQTEQRMSLLFVRSQDGKSFTIYIPEMDVKTLQEKPHIDVKVKDYYDQIGDYEIQLGEYDETSHKFIENSYFDFLLRNHRYKYNIISITENSIELTVTVNDSWDVIHNMELQ